jgi:hypothetical protein
MPVGALSQNCSHAHLDRHENPRSPHGGFARVKAASTSAYDAPRDRCVLKVAGSVCRWESGAAYSRQFFLMYLLACSISSSCVVFCVRK